MGYYRCFELLHFIILVIISFWSKFRMLKECFEWKKTKNSNVFFFSDIISHDCVQFDKTNKDREESWWKLFCFFFVENGYLITWTNNYQHHIQCIAFIRHLNIKDFTILNFATLFPHVMDRGLNHFEKSVRDWKIYEIFLGFMGFLGFFGIYEIYEIFLRFMRFF